MERHMEEKAEVNLEARREELMPPEETLREELKEERKEREKDSRAHVKIAGKRDIVQDSALKEDRKEQRSDQEKEKDSK